MSTHVVRPDGAVSTGWDNPAEAHYLVLSDGNAATGISTLTPTVDRLTLPPLPAFVAEVTSVVARTAVLCGDGIGSVRLLLWDGTNLVTGPTWLAPADLTDFVWTPAVPGGGIWTPAKFALLEIRIECVAVAFTEVFAASVQLEVVTVDDLVIERRTVVCPLARCRICAPVGRPLVSAPGGPRTKVRAPAGRADVVVPSRRVSVTAGPTLG